MPLTVYHIKMYIIIIIIIIIISHALLTDFH